MNEYENIAKKLIRGKYSLKQLKISAKEIHQMREEGYNIKSEVSRRTRYYWIKTIDKNNHYIMSHGTVEPKEVTWAEVSDIHAGCESFDGKGLRWFLQQVKDMGIKHIHNSGDSVDGIGVYRGHINYLKYNREQDQIKELTDIIGEFENDFKWVAIDGNHDISWINKGAPSPNFLISQAVKNYTYIPGYGADRVVRGDIIIHGVMKRLVHPWSNSGRATYAKSYPGQVYLRNVMDNGVQFEIGDKKYHMKMLQYGHLHFDMVYETYGVHVTHPMSFQNLK